MNTMFEHYKISHWVELVNNILNLSVEIVAIIPYYYDITSVYQKVNFEYINSLSITEGKFGYSIKILHVFNLTRFFPVSYLF